MGLFDGFPDLMKKYFTATGTCQNNAKEIDRTEYYDNEAYNNYVSDHFGVGGVSLSQEERRSILHTKNKHIGIGYNTDDEQKVAFPHAEGFPGKGVTNATYKNGKCHATCSVPYFNSATKKTVDLQYPCTWNMEVVLPNVKKTPIITLDIVPKTDKYCNKIKSRKYCNLGCKWNSNSELCVSDKDFVPYNM